MSEADKTFEELGYKKKQETKDFVLYTKNELVISIHKKDKTIGINTDNPLFIACVTGATVLAVIVNAETSFIASSFLEIN